MNIKLMKHIMTAVMLAVSFLATTSCAGLVVRGVADALTASTGTTFTGEDDPELVGDAIPFALKLYDSLLASAPDHQKLLIANGSYYIMYANAFVQGPAAMLPMEDFEKKDAMLKRSKNLYLRGRDMVLTALELKYNGLTNAIPIDQGTKFDAILKRMNRDDVTALYWCSAGWVAAFSLDSFDLGLSMSVPRAAAMMKRAEELWPDYNNGTIYDFFISFYGGLPAALGGSKDLARSYFIKATNVSKGTSASPYVAMATSIAIPAQDYVLYTNMLTTAAEVNPDKNISNRLANIISIRKAHFLMKNAGEYFLIDDGDANKDAAPAKK
ncbi:MAG: TRAP transporter TatT component family protein [Spirochaetes bacterium]|nr:TRAP transporter TatT component family protein [Spirochaetota bacterium]